MVAHSRRRALVLLGAGIAAGAAAGLTTGFTQRQQRVDDQHLQLGDLSLLVQADPWRMTLLGPAGDIVWQEAADQPIGYTTGSGGAHRARSLASAQVIGDGAYQLLARTDDLLGAGMAVEVRRLGPRLFRIIVTPDMPAGAVSVSGSFGIGRDEEFVGFGERFDSVRQRGKTVDVWAEDRRVANYGLSTYAPLPLLLSNRGYSFTLERFERSRFDLAINDADRWSWEQQTASASILVGYGATLADLVMSNAQTSGLPPRPPMWGFGVCKTAVGGQSEVIAEMQRLRDAQVPVSAVFSYDAVDSDANVGWPSVTYAGRSAGPYPNHVAYTTALHQLGYKVLNYFTADYHLDRPNWQEPSGHGFLVKQADGRPYIHPGFKVSWVDFTDPDAVLWWGLTWRRALGDLGYDGGMLDLGELMPGDGYFTDGTTGLQSHNRYPLLYAKAAWEQASRVRSDGDFLLLVRSGALGAQRYQSLQWPGDPVMRWEAPDGLQSLVPAALSFGLSGFPFWHAEVAGYVTAGLGPAQERELWLRWLQLGTWSAMLRDHYGDHPAGSVDAYTDEATLTAFRDAARIHNSLVPYLYSLAVEATRSGMPLLRYMPLETPEDPRAWREEQSYFLGPLFLVAPVTQPGATSRTAYLPAGQWVDYWSGTPYEGGADVTVAAPLDGGRPPVFVRAGAMVPLAQDFDTLAPSNMPGVRTYTGDLLVRIMPGVPRASDFTLYDGTRLRWNGSELRVEANAQPRTIELRLADGRTESRRIDGSEALIAPI